MNALKALGRGLGFLGKYVLAVVVMLAIGLAQAPAALWYVTSATPACDATPSDTAALLAQVGLVSVGLASAAVAVVLGVRFLELRWGWLLWWGVPVVACTAPAAAVYLLPRLLSDTGGMFCH